MRAIAFRLSTTLATVLLAAASWSTGPAHAAETAPRRAGIYLASGGAADSEPVRLTGKMLQKIRQTGMIKMMFTGGRAQGDIVATLDGAKAEVRAPAGVAFVFQLPSASGSSAAPNANPADLMSMMTGDYFPPQAHHVEEFLLIRLHAKGDTREADLGKPGRGAHSKSSSKDAVAFTTEPAGPGAFRVRPNEPLTPGEYAFSFSVPGQGPGGQVWDFGVD